MTFLKIWKMKGKGKKRRMGLNFSNNKTGSPECKYLKHKIIVIIFRLKMYIYFKSYGIKLVGFNLAKGLDLNTLTYNP